MAKADDCLVSCVIPFAGAVFVSALILLFMAIYLSVYGRDNITYFFKSSGKKDDKEEEAAPIVEQDNKSKREDKS